MSWPSGSLMKMAAPRSVSARTSPPWASTAARAVRQVVDAPKRDVGQAEAG